MRSVLTLRYLDGLVGQLLVHLVSGCCSPTCIVELSPFILLIAKQVAKHFTTPHGLCFISGTQRLMCTEILKT